MLWHHLLPRSVRGSVFMAAAAICFVQAPARAKNGQAHATTLPAAMRKRRAAAGYNDT